MLRRFPLFSIVMFVASLFMLIPGLHAMRLGDWDTMRAFYYHGLFFAIVSVILGLGLMTWRIKTTPRDQLVMLVAVFVLLPLIFAMPLNYLVPTISYAQSYFEMLSSFTTTGASIFNDPGTISEPLNLWRASVAWMGGFIILLAAFAIMEPMSLGGFEIEASVSAASGSQRRTLGGARSVQERLFHHARLIAPVYILMTGVLALALIIAGERVYLAICHAMSVLSTSGISPLKFGEPGQSGLFGEILIAIFLLFALTRKGFSVAIAGRWTPPSLKDPELRLAMICIVMVTGLISLRHMLGAFEIEDLGDTTAALQSLWGAVFTVLSYLTTFGFESQYWDTAADWSGLSTPGILLLGLAVMGGGVATTAGGVKLLRLFALYKHGVREMQRLVHPNSVGGAGVTARRIRRRGAFVAWFFLMLFMISIALITLVLGATGLKFEHALAVAIATLTNTGPAIAVFDADFTYRSLNVGQLLILDLSMLIGRMEVLVVVALFNFSFWRN